LTVTPLQLAYSIGGIASGGRFIRPHLVSTDELTVQGLQLPSDPEGEVRVALSEATVAAVTDALYGVVNEGGTGGRARIPGVDVGGKTGTAQVASLEAARNAREGGGGLKDNAWFVGLAPRRNPEIVVVVLYQSGEHGYLAAPLAREVIKTYFDKKKGVQPQLANHEERGPQPAASLVPSDRAGG
jgi:penicillin-binding protein 2